MTSTHCKISSNMRVRATRGQNKQTFARIEPEKFIQNADSGCVKTVLLFAVLLYI